MLAALPLLGCGAGLVGGIASSDGGSSSSPPPSLSLPTQAVPLAPSPFALRRTIVVTNVPVPASAALQVQLRVPGPQLPDGAPGYRAVADQRAPAILSGQGSSTVLGFDLETGPIVAALGAGADVAAEFAVRIDGREVAAPLPVTLLAQPSARLFDSPDLLLSPTGGQRVRLACTGLRSSDISLVQVSVTTRDETGVQATVTRVCLRPAFEQADPERDPPLLPGEVLISAEAPGNTFAGAATLLVDDGTAGRSRPVDGAHYRPEVAVALPAQGSARGGTKVTLIGRALLPLEKGPGAGRPDFDALQVQLRKGDRIVDLPSGALVREESSLDRLVMFLPPSPDGRPGDVGIGLRLRIDEPPKLPIDLEVTAQGVFLYANPEPLFGPRGVLLDAGPIAVAPIALEGAPDSVQATDFAVLYSVGGAAAVQLLAAQENGLFIRFGPTRRIGDADVDAERGPVDLASGDFDRDGVPDLAALNQGSAAGGATLLLVLGQAAPLAPLGPTLRLAVPAGMKQMRVADFDGDGGPDVLLIPGPAASATQPLLLCSRASAGGVEFLPAVPAPVRSYGYEACDVFDFDGDGALDVAVGRGGLQPALDLAYGDGFGGFLGAAALDFSVPRTGYVLDAASPMVGLHAMGQAPCAVSVVLAGLPGAATPTPPIALLIRPSGPRSFSQPSAAEVLLVPGALDPFRASIAANLDGDGPPRDELLLGTTGELGQFSLGLFRFDDAAGLQAIRIITEFRPSFVADFFVGTAFPAEPSQGRPAQMGLFVQHELSVDGQVEQRLSTLLVSRDDTDVLLLPPDVVFPVPLASVVGGRFSAQPQPQTPSSLDLAVPAATQIQLGYNDGFGAIAPGSRMSHLGIVPETTARLPQPQLATDSLAFLDDGSRDGRTDGALRLGLWRPDPMGPLVQSPGLFSADLRPLLPVDLQGEAVDPRSSLMVADVDSDGAADLLMLLHFLGREAEGDAVLLHFRGDPLAGAEEMPLLAPQAQDVARLHGGSRGLALGDFAADSLLVPPLLELAVAVPRDGPLAEDGNHVRFYRLVSSGAAAAARWVRSHDVAGARALVVGNAPTQLAAGDFDGNGAVDLMVACDDDSTLRVLLNTGQPAVAAGEVAVAAFVESFGSPLPTPVGRHTHMLLGDIDGDGNVDALMSTEATTTSGELSTRVTFHLSSGAGEFGAGRSVSPSRLSNRDAPLSLQLFDLNRDGLPDLTLGWAQSGSQSNNLLVLLGGSL